MTTDNLHWYCVHCGDAEQAKPPYEYGDMEPCTCGNGIARVMTLQESARLSQRVALGWKPKSVYK